MMVKQTEQITELKKAANAMYEEYVAKRDTDKGAADYAWEMYLSLDRQIEQLEAK